MPIRQVLKGKLNPLLHPAFALSFFISNIEFEYYFLLVHLLLYECCTILQETIYSQIRAEIFIVNSKKNITLHNICRN